MIYTGGAILFICISGAFQRRFEAPGSRFPLQEVPVLSVRPKNKTLPVRTVNPARILGMSFSLIILVGTLLLILPISSKSGHSTGALTALFTATSATCVTGLAVVPTGTWWSPFGQLVILVMIQLGGLGLMTAIYTFAVLMHRRLTISDQMVLMNALNLSSMNSLAKVASNSFRITAAFELSGAVLLSARFVPQYGPVGIWYGIFHSVSAFCNAGFDLLGGMEQFVTDPIVNLILITLVICSGFGFFVWTELLSLRSWKKLSLYSRMVLSATAVLVVSGMVLFLLLEWGNPDTFGPLSPIQKGMAALFQSVTLRTAGFSTVAQSGLTESGKALSVLYMLVGGCSGSTAGGIKVGTICILLLALRASLYGRETVTLGGRAIRSSQVFSALALTLLVAMAAFFGALLVSILEGCPFLSALFETASAIATVGLSADLTPSLSPLSRLIIIILMYLGRVGILSFFLSVLTRKNTSEKIRYPYTDMMVG